MKKEITIDGQTYVLKEEVKTNIMEIPTQKLEWGKTCEEKLNWDDAKEWCEEQGEGWRLPTLEELHEAYRHKISGFTSSFYWSSTENNSYSAWGENFIDGDQLNSNKLFGNYVRCIRSLTI